MKKLSCVLLLLVIVVTSCSSEDSPSLSTEGILLRKTIGNINNDSEYFYNGNKLNKIVTSNGSKFEYVYSGNLITQILYYENDILKEKNEMSYDSEERLINKMRFNYNNNSGIRTDYIYNQDGTVSVKGFLGDFNIQSTQYNDRKVFFYSDGNVEKIERYEVIEGVNHIKTSLFTYDDKNYFGNAIVGFNKVKNWEFGMITGFNNVISETVTTTENSSSYTYNSTFTYNSFDYPVTLNYLSLNVEYFYQ
jgi:hypothetical protein